MRRFQSKRAGNVGGHRGGLGGGYERTDPDYERKRLRRMAAEYSSLDEHWRKTYLGGLSDTDRRALTRFLKGEDDLH
jgi:hypothetical protein